MHILGVNNPQGRKNAMSRWLFLSTCGKTNFSMMVPPTAFEGWKVTAIGDDIAWIKPNADCRLYAINPESGHFSVSPGVNMRFGWSIRKGPAVALVST